MSQPTPAAEIIDEASRLNGQAEAAGITVRLLGGAAVALSAPAPLPAPLQRPYQDLDYVVRRADAARWRDLLEANGYAADATFNALHGAQRLLHFDVVHERQLDTFVSSFAMCHSLDLEDRLPAGSMTLAPADLLLTKLQIFEVNDKDLIDSIALLLSHPVLNHPVFNHPGPTNAGPMHPGPSHPGAADGPGIDAGRLAKVAGADWGWHTTLSDNLAKVAQRLPSAGLSEADTQTVATRLAEISETLTAAPKSLKWRARAKIGRRVPWYDLPEEVG
jgi:hypothetical protein